MNLIFVVLIIAGLIQLNRLPIEQYPDVSLDMATITTMWFGASSEEVERLITRKIEEEIEDVRGADRVVSISQPDLSSITVKFREDISDAEFEAAFSDLRTRLDRVNDLPADVEEPVLERVSTDEVMPLVQVAVVNYGGVEESMIRRVAESLKDRVRGLAGVTQVRIIGMRQPELHVLLDKAQLEKYGLSLAQVADALRASNMNLPAGYLPTGDAEITIRSEGEIQQPRDLGDVRIVRSLRGSHVRLRDIAQIEETFERAVWGARVNGAPAVLLYVLKDKNVNSLEVRAALGDMVAEYEKNLGIDGIKLEIQADSTAVISGRLEVLKNNLFVGLLLVFGVMWVTVGARNSLLAIVGIPFAFLCAIIFMRVLDVSLNAVSVFSLVLVMGMIVDDAIVVLENIYRHMELGKPVRDAVIVGCDEVVWPVITSSLTTVAAFLPLLVMTGVLGEFFSIIPKTVAVALLASLFECLVILPIHYLEWGPRGKKRTTGQVKGPGPFRRRFLAVYDRVLGQFLANRYYGLIALAACVIFVWQSMGVLTKEMFPSDFPTFVVDFHARPGSTLEATAREVDRFTPVLDSFKPERIVRASASIGVLFNDDNQRILRPDVAQMWVDVSPSVKRAADPSKTINAVRIALNDFLDAHPDSGIEKLRVWPIRDGPPVGKPVAIRIEHPDYDEARKVADDMKARLAEMPGVIDISDNLQLGGRELVLKIDDARASELGLTFLDVATALRGARDGLLVGVYKDTLHDEDVDIKVRYAEEYVQDIDQLLDVDVLSPVTGQLVKLHQVGELSFDQSYTNRYHYDSNRAVMVTADVDTDVTDAAIVNSAILEEFKKRADDRLNIVAGGQFAETQASFESLMDSGVIALGLMYLILASQFRSYAQPLVVLTAVLFGMMGMLTGLVFNGYPFSVVTGIAMVGLSGVVVNDALVLLDFINKTRREGRPVVEAIHIACRNRMRPILLTTVTTIAGLLPMALGVGGYSKIWSPFATSMCWGLTVATLLTLCVVPALYLILEDAKRFISSLVRRSPSSPPADTASNI